MSRTGASKRRTARAAGDARPDPAVLERLSADDADQALGRMLADEVNFALASVAAEPDRRFRKGSLAARLKALYRKRRAAVRAGSTERARSLLQLPLERRRRLFGSFADQPAESLDRPRLGPGSAHRALIDHLLQKRLQGFASKGSLVGWIADHRFFGPSRTTVEAVRNLTGDLPQVLGHEVSMVGSPDFIGFRWWTAEPEAEELRWELYAHGANEPIASGSEGPAPEGTFVIDFKDHLPPKPAKFPLRYVLRCQTWVERKIHHIGGSTVKEPARPTGAPAPPVRIVYARDQSATQFDFAEAYRDLDLYVDSITMVQDQVGGGDEEFWVTGMVQEVFGEGTGQESAGPLLSLRTKHKVLPPEPGAVAHFHDAAERRYRLNNPDAPPTDHPWWPRTYAVTVTVWEEDGGDEVAAFVSELSSLLNDYLENDWADAVIDVLEWLGIELTPLQVQQLTAILFAVSSASIIGIVTAAVGFILATIVADLGDDYYGTKTSKLRLPSSEAEALHGVLIDGKPGSQLPDGGWRFATDVLEFKGAPGASSASAFDGIVEIRLHWEALGREVWR